MVDYQIMGSHSGKEIQVGGGESAAKTFGFYNAAINGRLPVTGVRILADGVQIGVGQLRKRALAENAR